MSFMGARPTRVERGMTVRISSILVCGGVPQEPQAEQLTRGEQQVLWDPVGDTPSTLSCRPALQHVLSDP